MEPTNGTDEGVLRAWLNRESDEWIRAFVSTLDDAIQHLQEVCFEEHWGELKARGISDELSGMASLELYRDGLVDIFRFVRASGAVADDLSWSQMKAEHRALASGPHIEPPVRQALEDGLYAAESTPLGDHAIYRSWTRTIMLFLYQYVASGPQYPGTGASDEEKIAWGYESLRPIEEHAAFHGALAAYLHDPGVRPVAKELVDYPLEEIIRLGDRLVAMPRFDLILNTGLQWVVGAVERE